jgi:hypothetical protein
MPEKKRKAILVNYVDNQGTPKTEYVKQNPKKSVFTSNSGYHPTAIIGACSVCKTVGTIEFPQGFDFTTGDNVMTGHKVKVFCLRCRRETEFIPAKVKPGEKNEDALKLLARSQREMLEKLKGKP